MSQRSKLILSWVLVVVWAAFIFFMSAHTGSDLDEGTGLTAQIKRWLTSLATPLFGPDTDIVSVGAHFTEYLVFGVLLFAALLQSLPGRPLWVVALVAIAFASLYGVTDEFHQSFVPNRMCDPADWLTDTLGATLGACVTSAVAAAKGKGRTERP